MADLIVVLEDDGTVQPYTSFVHTSFERAKERVAEAVLKRWEAEEPFPRRLIFVVHNSLPIVDDDGGWAFASEMLANPEVHELIPKHKGIELEEG